MFKIVLLGDGGVGKTTLIIQLCLNKFMDGYDPTIEDSYRKHLIIDEQPCILEILDTAGQVLSTAYCPFVNADLQSIVRYFGCRGVYCFEGSVDTEGEGFVLVYSITARSTFERIERFRSQILRVKDTESMPIILVGNKADKVNEREVGEDEGLACARKMGCDFVETSAKTRLNVEAAYFNLIRAIMALREGDRKRPKERKRRFVSL
ncbi:hypothetical protein PSTT_00668 [Puccinia striiformis]|uniref:Ras family, other n=1 Tax=Puccinia striiformis TaxID=27350 RepID=A0A2S4W685_9BASI|nr:hypothetical protein PSTT_00668 [Puccinia striiformis]